MVSIDVNGKCIEASNGEILLEVLKRAGVRVPTLCAMKDLFPSGACRMCVVEVEGARGLVPSCAYPVSDGIKVKTHSPRVIKARKTILELLLANHPDDCLYCSRNNSCELRQLAVELDVRDRRFAKPLICHEIDNSSPAIIRDQSKCILCGRCVRTCEEVMGVAAIDFCMRGSQTSVQPAFRDGLNLSTCVSCGQCVRVCPTGALSEVSHINPVLEALQDSTKFVVVQHAPAVSVTLGEEFNLPVGTDVDGWMVAALRRIGFDKVFDTSFTADLTIMEEGSEFISRLTKGDSLPMFTSCSPAWVAYVENFFPQFIPNLSTCKSPQQMLGALIKTFFAKQIGKEPKDIVSVSIMPCTAKKMEAARPEMTSSNQVPDIDYVLTTRELAVLLRKMGQDLQVLQPEKADRLLSEHSSAGKMFGGTGGVMEAAIRTVHALVTGKELKHLELREVRGLEGIKEATVKVGPHNVRIAVVSGLENAKQVLTDIANGVRIYHFVEVMSCPGGCINGGGQPFTLDPERIRQRLQSLYNIDKHAPVRVSHKNPEVADLYRTFLGEPLGELSHQLLHTHYRKREGR